MPTMQHELQSGAALPESWVCPFCYTTGCTTPGACKELALRNEVLDEVAKEFYKMKSLGDTAASFAAFVRNMKR
jgi:hypothetical protein